jgi:hypothetical protein
MPSAHVGVVPYRGNCRYFWFNSIYISNMNTGDFFPSSTKETVNRGGGVGDIYKEVLLEMFYILFITKCFGVKLAHLFCVIRKGTINIRNIWVW